MLDPSISRTKRRLAYRGALGVALLGALCAGFLQAAHLELVGGKLASICGGESSGCGAVLASGWAWLPPLPDGGAASSSGHVPVSALGTAYFLAVLAWLATLGTAALQRRRLFVTLYAVVLFACIGSVGYIAVMLSIGALCPFCLGAHVANFALLVLLYLAGPRDGERASASVASRHVLAALATALLLAASMLLGGDALAARAERDALAAELQGIHDEAGLIELAHLGDRTFTRDEEARARFDAIFRADDPQLPPTGGSHGTLVYFSDLECPNCHRFELFLRDVLRPMFAGHLRIVFKHFPLEHLHDNALPAARALEAARLQGRFWQMHGVLVERHAELGELDYTALAGELGLDVERYRRDMQSDEVLARIEEDERLARSIGIDSTPSVFLDRRPVAGSIRTLTGFWQMRADALRRSREARGETW